MAIRFTIFPPGDASRPSTIDFDLDKITVGRGAICDLRLPHPSVSYHHATVEVDGSKYSIRDLTSTNGTKVNSTRIPPDFRHPIRSDDIIEIAGFRICPTLSVAVQGTHSDERTETLARGLLRDTSPARGPARLEVLDGPDAGTSLDLEAGRTVFVGRDASCDLRLSDPTLGPGLLELTPSISGWRLLVTAPGGRPTKDTRLSDGQVISLGSTRIRFTDPLDAYYTLLLRTRGELDPGRVPAAPPPACGKESAPREPRKERRRPASDAPAAPEGRITSRSEIVEAARSRSRMPEFSWMVVVLGVLAFLASLGLLLVIMF